MHACARELGRERGGSKGVRERRRSGKKKDEGGEEKMHAKNRERGVML